MFKETIVIRGGGDIATGVAHRLHRSGFNILILEVEKPLVIRRTVAFAQAIFSGEWEVEGVQAVKVSSYTDINNSWNKREIPVLVDPECKILGKIKANVLIDAILAKKNLGTNIDMAPVTIGLGPGFEVGKDVSAVIETNRGHDLGRVILSGCAQPNTGVPGMVMGYDLDRVIRAPRGGEIKNSLPIGSLVKKGDTIAQIEDTPILATIDGVLRGMITEGLTVCKDLKIADIDPRAKKDYCFTISEKARAVGGGVLEAILYFRHNGIHF